MEFTPYTLISKMPTQPWMVLLIHSIFALSIVFCYQASDIELQKQANTQEIIATTTIISKLFYDSGLAIGAYSLTKNQAFIDRYKMLNNQISPTVETLHMLVEKQPVKEISFTEITKLTEEALKQMNDAKTMLNTNTISPLSDDQGEIHSLYKRIKALADQLQNKLDQLAQAEESLAKNSSNNRQIDQIILSLVFLSYIGLNIALHLQYLKSMATNQNFIAKIE